MKRILFFFLALFMVAGVSNAKSYKFEFKHTYNVYQIQTGRNGVKVVEAWAIAKNADKAIDQCKMDAVAAAIFTGIPVAEGAMGVSPIPPLLDAAAYDANKAWFDEFFKKGRFMEFVSEINSTYPTGENNIQCPGGRKVTILLGVREEELRKFLEENGLKKKLSDHFNAQ